MTSVLVVFLYPGEPSQLAAGTSYFLNLNCPKVLAIIFSIAVCLNVITSF